MALRILILTDSRGYALRAQLRYMDLIGCGVVIHIMPYSGARIEDIVRKGLRDCHMYRYDRVYFMGGVNNLSKKVNGMAIPEYNSWDILVRDIMIKLYQARVALKRLANEVVICDLIGMNFCNYNYGLESYAFPYQQSTLDRAVLRINEYVTEMNTDMGLKGPQLGDIVHKKRGESRMENRYWSTCHDGLHFNRNTAVKVMDRLMLAILYKSLEVGGPQQYFDCRQGCSGEHTPPTRRPL